MGAAHQEDHFPLSGGTQGGNFIRIHSPEGAIYISDGRSPSREGTMIKSREAAEYLSAFPNWRVCLKNIVIFVTKLTIRNVKTN